MPTGAKTGSLQILPNCAGVNPNQSLAFSGSAAPSYSLTAPAAASGTIASNTITFASNQTFAGTEKVALYWIANNVAYYAYDVAINAGTSQTTFAINSSGAGGTAPPSGGQSIVVAVNQDLTLANEGVSIPGNAVQQLIATSTQVGLLEWQAANAAQQRLSYFPSAGSFDTWPLQASAVAPPPTGGSGNNWSNATNVTTLRFWNFGTSTATMQAGAIVS